MKKPMYTREEIQRFLSGLNKCVEDNDDTREYDDAIETVRNSTEEYLDSPLDINEFPFDVFHGIAHEAYVLEQRAKELRKVVRTFRKPIEEIFTEVSSENPVLASIVHWRLALGR